MTLLNIISVIVIAISCGTIIFVRLRKLKKNNVTITVDTIIEEYGDNIINILQDFIEIMQININDYPTKEDYIADLISLCVDSIQDNYGMTGIDTSILKFVDREQLAVCVSKVLESNKVECFSILPSEEITNNEKYFDEEVVEALTIIESEEVSVETLVDGQINNDSSNTDEFVSVNTTTDFEPYTVSISEETESYVVAETPEVEALSCEATADSNSEEFVEDAFVVETDESITTLEAKEVHVEETVDTSVSTDDSTESIDK